MTPSTNEHEAALAPDKNEYRDDTNTRQPDLGRRSVPKFLSYHIKSLIVPKLATMISSLLTEYFHLVLRFDRG